MPKRLRKKLPKMASTAEHEASGGGQGEAKHALRGEVAEAGAAPDMSSKQ